MDEDMNDFIIIPKESKIYNVIDKIVKYIPKKLIVCLLLSSIYNMIDPIIIIKLLIKLL